MRNIKFHMVNIYCTVTMFQALIGDTAMNHLSLQCTIFEVEVIVLKYATIMHSSMKSVPGGKHARN